MIEKEKRITEEHPMTYLQVDEDEYEVFEINHAGFNTLKNRTVDLKKLKSLYCTKKPSSIWNR